MHFGNADQNFFSEPQNDVKAQVSLLSRMRIGHASWAAALSQIQELHLLREVRQEGSGILLLGEAGTGKTTLLRTIETSFPKRKEPQREHVPCVYARIPSRPSIKATGQVLLRALGDPLAFRGSQTAAEITYRVVTLLAQCGTELILLDELAHLVDGRRADSLSSVADWLKELADASRAPVVLAGLPRSEAVLLSNDQLRRRFSASLCLEVASFEEGNNDFPEFRGVIKQVALNISVRCDVDLSSPDIARLLLFATEGRIGYLIALISSAVRICHRNARPIIDLAVLSEAFREAIWRTPAPGRDPFTRNFNGKRLTGLNEPFSELTGQPSKKKALSEPKN